MTNLIGQEIGGYRIEEQIGQGGMATVYKAYEAATDRYVALKILPHLYSQDSKLVERFKREARAIAKLEHIHILPIHAYGEQDGIIYLAMRYMPTGSLKDRIQQGALPLHEASRLLGQIAGALDHAHRHGILHRDVKPANVLLDEDENAYLTDFGIARMVGATADLTGGGVIGTPAYMPPEQLEGSAQVVPASDQYALGIVLYEMITGRTPYQAETPVAMITKKLTTPLPSPRAFNPNLPEAAEQVLLKALANDPAARFASCGELADQFAAALEGLPVDVQFPVASPDDLTYDSLPGTPAFAPTAAPAAPTVAAPRGMPAWLIGLIALLGIGVISAAIFFGLRGGRGSAALDSTQIGEAIAAATESSADQGEAPAGDTSDTSPTMQPTVPTPTTGVGLKFFENFDNLEFDGGYPLDQWTFSGASLDQINQQAGELVITQSGQPNGSTWLAAVPLTKFSIDQAMYFEADLKLAANQPADTQVSGIVYLQLRATFSDGTDWYSQCNISSFAPEGGSYSICRDFAIKRDVAGDVNPYVQSFDGDFDTWHHYRIEVDPATMVFSYYMDGTLVGYHTPVDAEALRDAQFDFQIGVWTKTDAPITGYVDNVRAGYLADEAADQPTPIAYDNFDNPAYDGTYDPSLWLLADSSPSRSNVSQENGYIALIRESIPTEEAIKLEATQYLDFQMDAPMFFEADLKLGEGATDGGVFISIVIGWDDEDYGLHTNCEVTPHGQAFCTRNWSNSNEWINTRSHAIDPFIWNTIRLEVYPAIPNFSFYVGESLIDSYQPEGTVDFTEALYGFSVGAWAPANESITGYVDNARIGYLADEAADQPTPTAYDNFDNPAYDGSFNTDIWTNGDDLPAEVLAAHQEDGRLVFDNVPFPEDMDRSIRSTDTWTQEDFDFVEGKLQLDDDVIGDGSVVKLQLAANIWEWWAEIHLAAGTATDDPRFVCEIVLNNTRDELVTMPIAYNVWYTARIEVDWESETLNYYLDDQLECTYTLPTGTLDDATFRVELGVWQEANASIAAYIDDVLVGLLEP